MRCARIGIAAVILLIAVFKGAGSPTEPAPQLSVSETVQTTCMSAWGVNAPFCPKDHLCSVDHWQADGSRCWTARAFTVSH